MQVVENTLIVEEKSMNNQSSNQSLTGPQQNKNQPEVGYVVQRSKKPFESNRGLSDIKKQESMPKIITVEDFQQQVLSKSVQQSQLTNTYKIAVQDIDKHARADPSAITDSSSFSTQFKSTHPSLYLPKHSEYRKYKMKDGRNQSGLNILKEKPLATKQFAIVQKI